MPGTYSGGKLAAQVNKKRHGNDFYSRIGQLGGTAKHTTPRGFAANRHLAKYAGKVGGLSSRRGKPRTPVNRKLYEAALARLTEVKEQADRERYE